MAIKDTGWLNFNSFADGGGGNAESTPWINTSNAQTSNNSRATPTTNPVAIATITPFLHATNLATKVPIGVIIKGIEVSLEGCSLVGGFSGMYLIKNGSRSGDNKTPDWLSFFFGSDCYTEVTNVYGGAADLWSLGLTDDDVNASNFGFAMQYQFGLVGSILAVDHMKMKIYYTFGSSLLLTL